MRFMALDYILPKENMKNRETVIELHGIGLNLDQRENVIELRGIWLILEQGG